jgi:hypothetical protein
MQQTPENNRNKSDSDIALPKYESFPPPAMTSAQDKLSRNDSGLSASSTTSATKSQHIDEEYAQYTHAPPPFAESQYEGKSEEQQNRMRTADYAKELNRMMGRQLVRGLKDEESKADES